MASSIRALRDEDLSVPVSAVLALGRLKAPDVLVEALNRCGSDLMANDFFGRGNATLRRAALRRSRYYSKVEAPVVSPGDLSGAWARDEWGSA